MRTDSDNSSGYPVESDEKSQSRRELAAIADSHKAMNQFITDTCENLNLPQDAQHPKNIGELIALMELLEKNLQDKIQKATLSTEVTESPVGTESRPRRNNSS